MVTACDNVQQCIIDECGMCIELESLVPITFSKAKQVVLIGDHKQLQPVVIDQQALTLGLNISMFERLSDQAQMLEIQYRMVIKPFIASCFFTMVFCFKFIEHQLLAHIFSNLTLTNLPIFITAHLQRSHSLKTSTASCVRLLHSCTDFRNED